MPSGWRTTKSASPRQSAVDEGRLVDDRRTVAHRLLGVAGSDVPADLPGLADPDDVVAERSEVRSLVLLALAADELSVRVVPERLLELAARDGELERRQVRAGDEVREARRREAGASNVNHRQQIMPPSLSTYYEAVGNR